MAERNWRKREERLMDMWAEVPMYEGEGGLASRGMRRIIFLAWAGWRESRGWVSAVCRFFSFGTPCTTTWYLETWGSRGGAPRQLRALLSTSFAGGGDLPLTAKTRVHHEKAKRVWEDQGG